MNQHTINRRTFICNTALASGALALPTLFQAFAQQNSSLNVIILLTDDQRFDTIAALGNKDIITPNFDRLVKNGTAFTNAHIMGGLSGAICMPSRAMLLTGRTLFNVDRQPSGDQFSFDIMDTYITLPEYLSKKGYQTVGIGKQHNGREIYKRAFTDGAKVMFGGMSDQYNIPHYDFSKEGDYSKAKQYISKGKQSSEIYADETIRFLEKYKKQPFFIYTAFQSPHDPRQMPSKYLQWYDPDKIKLPVNFLPEHPFDNGDLQLRDEKLAAFPRTEAEIKKHLRDYYAMISHLDAQVGCILDAVQEKGLEKNTLIVFAGDNGLAVGQHGLMGKQNLYEHSIRVPLIIAGPDIPKNQKVAGLCYLTDIFPTITERVGLQTPESVQGQNLNPFVRKPDTPIRPALFFAYKDYQRAVKQDGFKLIEYHVQGKRTTQLFDLKNDPFEINNLAGNSTYASQVKQLREQLQTLRHQYGDIYSKFWEGYES